MGLSTGPTPGGGGRRWPLLDNLGAAELTLPADPVVTLDETTGFRPGFPTEFIEETSGRVYGETGHRVVPRTVRG